MLTAVPVSPIARAATDLLVVTSPSHLVNHCLRTFQFAMMLADVEGAAPDPEMVYLGSALHDLGLTERYDDGPEGFEINGASAADTFLKGEGYDSSRRGVVVDAIRLHLLLTTAADPRPEVAAVSQGAALDVVGIGVDRLSTPALSAVLEAHPRLEFKKELSTLMQRQAAVRPTSTMALYLQGGMLDMIDTTPFAS